MADALILYTNRLFEGDRSQVQRWGHRLGSHFKQVAVAWAPARSGELKASIFYDVQGRGKQMDINVGSHGSIAPHNFYVLMGTGQHVGRPRLRNPHGMALPVGRDRAYGPKRLVFNEGQEYMWAGRGPFIGRGVSGQASNNFFRFAHRFVIPLHPSTAYIAWHDTPGSF